jgi:hypothetical protein
MQVMPAQGSSNTRDGGLALGWEVGLGPGVRSATKRDATHTGVSIGLWELTTCVPQEAPAPPEPPPGGASARSPACRPCLGKKPGSPEGGRKGKHRFRPRVGDSASTIETRCQVSAGTMPPRCNIKGNYFVCCSVPAVELQQTQNIKTTMQVLAKLVYGARSAFFRHNDGRNNV